METEDNCSRYFAKPSALGLLSRACVVFARGMIRCPLPAHERRRREMKAHFFAKLNTIAGSRLRSMMSLMILNRSLPCPCLLVPFLLPSTFAPSAIAFSSGLDWRVTIAFWKTCITRGRRSNSNCVIHASSRTQLFAGFKVARATQGSTHTLPKISTWKLFSLKRPLLSTTRYSPSPPAGKM